MIRSDRSAASTKRSWKSRIEGSMLQVSGWQTVRVTYFEQDTLKEGGAYVTALEGEALRETEQF